MINKIKFLDNFNKIPLNRISWVSLEPRRLQRIILCGTDSRPNKAKVSIIVSTF